MSKNVNINKVFISGYLVKDVQYQKTKTNNTLVANFRIINVRKFRNANGDPKEEACTINVIAWSKLADICNNRNLQKGDYVFVEGILQTKKWGPDDDKKQTNEVMAKNIQIFANDQQQDDRDNSNYDDVPEEDGNN